MKKASLASCLCWILASSFVFLSPFLWQVAAQAVATASVLGRVTDPSGALVPGVEVTVTNLATAISRSTTTDDAGAYTVTHLRPGDYQITAELPGFKRAVLGGIALRVAQEARIDITLELGEVSQEVNVSASAPLAETESPTIGSVIEEKTISQLPLKGRNFMELTTLTGGINEGGDSSSKRDDITAKPFNPSTAGQAQVQNVYYLDGVQNMDQMWRTYNVAPSVDAVQEFRIQVGQYSAEFGGGGGAIVSVVTKSGSNKFHGTVFEFHRNDNLDAKNFFAKATPQLVLNQFGFSLGGPIIKNRTFFFGNYEALRERRGLTGLATVPTTSQKAGDLSGLGKTIIDPSTGKAFLANRIPQERIDPISKRILEFYPAPNNPTQAQNYLRSPSQTINNDSFLLKIDHQLANGHELMGRYAFQQVDHFTPGTFPLVGGADFPQQFQNVAVGLTSILTPSIVNELRFAFNRTENDSQSQNSGKGIGQALGMPFPADPPGDRFPSISFSRTSITGLGETASRITRTSDFHISDSVTINRGRHIVKSGTSLKRIGDAFSSVGTHTNGSYTFSGQFTGDGFADFLLGIPNTATILPAPRLAIYTQRALAGYVMDDWKVSDRLTLNLGLRYEFESFPKEGAGNTPMFDIELKGLRYPSQNTTAKAFYTNLRPDLPWGMLNRTTAMKADTNNFDPRFGFAFRPFGKTTTVVRGGYGLFHTLTEIINLMNNVTAAPPSGLLASFTSTPDVPSLTYRGPSDFSGAFEQLVKRSTFGFPGSPVDDQFLNGYTQQWSLSLSRELTSDLVVQAQYLGSKSTHLENSYDINWTQPAPGALQQRVPFPKWNRIFAFANGGNANYNSMILSAEQRFARGLGFKAAYTWGKSLASRGTRTVSSHIGQVQNPGNLKDEVNLTPDDMKHRLVINYVWDLPFGPARPIGGSIKGLAAKLLEGWQVSGIFTYRSGLILSGPTIAGVNCNSSFSNRCLPDRLRDPNLGDNGVDTPRFDAKAFDWPRNPAHAPQPPRFGNAGQNFLRGNSVHLWDTSLIKHFALTEEMDLEFRFEMFNAVNHPNFGSPNISPESPFFGRTFSTSTNARELQFGLKLIW